MVVHCRAKGATGAPTALLLYNKLQFSCLTSNQVVGASNFSGRAKKSNGPKEDLLRPNTVENVAFNTNKNYDCRVRVSYSKKESGDASIFWQLPDVRLSREEK